MNIEGMKRALHIRHRELVVALAEAGQIGETLRADGVQLGRTGSEIWMTAVTRAPVLSMEYHAAATRLREAAVELES
jgi:hypothetical protein